MNDDRRIVEVFRPIDAVSASDRCRRAEVLFRVRRFSAAFDLFPTRPT